MLWNEGPKRTQQVRRDIIMFIAYRENMKTLFLA